MYNIYIHTHIYILIFIQIHICTCYLSRDQYVNDFYFFFYKQKVNIYNIEYNFVDLNNTNVYKYFFFLKT